jgi:formate dehydrogenase subunit delta
MSSNTLATLRRMANDIARNLEAMGHDKAVLATADHIDKFWDPRMKKAIFADDERFAVLTPIAAAAIDHLAAGAHPESQTRATEFNTADEIGHSDAG